MKGLRLVGILVCSILLCSCAGKQQATATAPVRNEYPGVSRIEGVSLETVRQEAKVTTGYKNIVLNPIQTDSQFGKDYPDMASQFQISMFSYLKDKKSYKQIVLRDAADQSVKADTLIAEVRVIDMRIVSTGARFWGGVMVGSSYMDVYLKLTDAVSKKVIHEKIITTNNNVFASAWALGSEQSLPMDMGKIIGEYICVVAPAI